LIRKSMKRSESKKSAKKSNCRSLRLKIVIRKKLVKSNRTIIQALLK
jgi:hypothetical protein